MQIFELRLNNGASLDLESPQYRIDIGMFLSCSSHASGEYLHVDSSYKSNLDIL
jgi:hypothetical protein